MISFLQHQLFFFLSVSRSISDTIELLFNLFEDEIDVPKGAKVASKNGYYRQRMIPVKIFGRFATSAIVRSRRHSRLHVRGAVIAS